MSSHDRPVEEETDSGEEASSNGEVPAEYHRDQLRGRTFSLSNPPMPWFGLDVGGTLVKLVYFEPTDEQVEDDGQEAFMVNNIRKFLTSNRTYGDTGIRDVHLQLDKQLINGRVGSLHFIRFPTYTMPDFIHLAKSKGLAACASTVCATGGGAYKYESMCREELNLELNKFDEFHSLICGIQYIVEHYPDECYYYEHPLDDERCQQVPYHRRGRGNSPLQPPYLVVNIGSGVSILAVDGTNKFRRVSGTSLGGGMFHGLCCLLCGCETFEEAVDLASKGDHRNVDKLVRDIYGGDYQLFGLPADAVAASFGQMIYNEKRSEVSKEDLARSALVTLTNNISSIARMCALTEKIDTIIFVGNFLRVNTISMRLLAFSMEYWSNGAMKAVFLHHEGYLGAVGCLMNLMRLSEARKWQKMNERLPSDISSTSSSPSKASTSKTSSNTVQDRIRVNVEATVTFSKTENGGDSQ